VYEFPNCRVSSAKEPYKKRALFKKSPANICRALFAGLFLKRALFLDLWRKRPDALGSLLGAPEESTHQNMGWRYVIIRVTLEFMGLHMP